MVRQVDEQLLKIGRVQEGDLVVIIAGSPPGIPGSTNALRIHRMGDAINEVAPAYRSHRLSQYDRRQGGDRSRSGCPGWDSNPHLGLVFETTSSAVGIPGRRRQTVPDSIRLLVRDHPRTRRPAS